MSRPADHSAYSIPLQQNKNTLKTFTRFYRVSNDRSLETAGSSLGLSICRMIAETHNGSIDLAVGPRRIEDHRPPSPTTMKRSRCSDLC